MGLCCGSMPEGGSSALRPLPGSEGEESATVHPPLHRGVSRGTLSNKHAPPAVTAEIRQSSSSPHALSKNRFLTVVISTVVALSANSSGSKVGVIRSRSRGNSGRVTHHFLPETPKDAQITPTLVPAASRNIDRTKPLGDMPIATLNYEKARSLVPFMAKTE